MRDGDMFRYIKDLEVSQRQEERRLRAEVNQQREIRDFHLSSMPEPAEEQPTDKQTNRQNDHGIPT